MDMSKPLVMGIINVTPDSFFDGNGSCSLEKALAQAKKLIAEGADLLDIGGESSRPGALPVSEEEELARIIPVIKELKKITPLPLSIDTRKPRVAVKALESGASIINDITGLIDPAMREAARAFSAEVCIMHMQNDPLTMQNNPCYDEGIIPSLLQWFEEQIKMAVKEGIAEHRIILDPGIGFGKSVQDNLDILNNLTLFKRFGLRLLVGLSRKSFMGNILKKSPRDLLPATLAMNTMALLAGADIIRVHDVAEHRDIAHLISSLKR